MINLYDDEGFFQEGIINDSFAAAKAQMKNLKDAKGVERVKKVNSGINKTNEYLSGKERQLSNNMIDNRSIIARARNSILQFPMYIVQSIRTSEAQIIAKMFERVYASLVQTVLSQNQILDEKEANDLVFLKKFHVNLQESAINIINEYYEAIDDIDQIMQESIFHREQISDNLFVEFRVVPTTEDLLIKENSRLLNEPLQGFIYLKEANDKNDNDETVETRTRTQETVDRTDDEIITDEMMVDIAKSRKLFHKDGPNKGEPDIEAVKKEIRSFQGINLDGKRIKVRRISSKGGYEYYIPGSSGKTISTEVNSRKMPKQSQYTPGVDAPRFLRDTDIKKMNDMLPYSMEATFRLKSDGKIVGDVKYIIGIKTVMHLIAVKDLAEDLREIITGNVKTLQKVRYKTGEIGFMDRYFNIKGIKADAAKNINRSKRWLNTLKRLGEYNRLHGSLFKKGLSAFTNGNIPVPNGTLILTKSDVISLTDETGIDLSIVDNAKRLGKALFLMAFVVVDSTAGKMNVLFIDGANSWDVQSLSSIDAELAKTDNSQLMKELNRMVNR